MRIVSLTCSNTEIVCALGCANQLVGVDNHSDYPPDIVHKLPRVGPDLSIDVEKVADLEPDLVLASLTVPGHEKVVEGISNAGLPYQSPEPICLSDVYQNILTIGDLLSVSQRAQRVVDEMQSAIVECTKVSYRPSVLIQWWPKPVIAPGKLSWVQDMMQLAGLDNPLADRDVKSTPLSDEEVAELNPDAVAISWCGVKYEKYRPKVVYRNPAWEESKFVKSQSVYRISEAYLGRPSPRLIEGYKALRKIAMEVQSQNHLH